MTKFNKDITNRINVAIALKNQKKYEESNDILMELFREHDDSPIISGLIAGNYYKMCQYEDSAYYFNRASRLSPSSELASIGLFHSLIELGYNDLAFEELDRFLSENEAKAYKVTLEELYHTINIENFTDSQLRIIFRYYKSN